MMRDKVTTALVALVWMLLGYLLGLATVWVVLGQPRLAINSSPAERSLPLFWEVWDIVQTDFIGQVPDSRTMTYGAIRGALGTLGDPYAALLESQARQREAESLQGKFGGIGVTMRRAESGQVILSPIADGPAQAAGVREGDSLLRVDSQPITPAVSFDAIAALVRGPVGSLVVIEVQRGTPPQALVFEIVRQEIELPSVTWHVVDAAPQVGYVGLSRFSERSGDEVERAVTELRAQGVTSLILDLRDNGGGLLQAGVEVASLFLADGVVMYQRSKNAPEQAFNVIPGGPALDLPLVILVNPGTASAAEIVAGALQDHGRAKVIGEKTFGKGSVQYIYDLSDGASLHITAAEWLTPHRRQLSGQGLQPDIMVARTPQDVSAGRDPQLEAALAYLAQAG